MSENSTYPISGARSYLETCYFSKCRQLWSRLLRRAYHSLSDSLFPIRCRCPPRMGLRLSTRQKLTCFCAPQYISVILGRISLSRMAPKSLEFASTFALDTLCGIQLIVSYFQIRPGSIDVHDRRLFIELDSWIIYVFSGCSLPTLWS